MLLPRAFMMNFWNADDVDIACHCNVINSCMLIILMFMVWMRKSTWKQHEQIKRKLTVAKNGHKQTRKKKIHDEVLKSTPCMWNDYKCSTINIHYNWWLHIFHPLSKQSQHSHLSFEQKEWRVLRVFEWVPILLCVVFLIFLSLWLTFVFANVMIVNFKRTPIIKHVL